VGNLLAETECFKKQALGNKHAWIFAYIIANLPLRDTHQNDVGEGKSFTNTCCNLPAENAFGTAWKLEELLIEWNVSIC
jgi:hypothetical protein